MQEPTLCCLTRWSAVVFDWDYKCAVGAQAKLRAGLRSPRYSQRISELQLCVSDRHRLRCGNKSSFRGCVSSLCPVIDSKGVQERLRESSWENSRIYPGDVCRRSNSNFLLFVEELSVEASIAASNVWTNGKAQEESVNKPFSIM